MAERRHLVLFDGLRGLAALAVVTSHVGIHERMQDLMDSLPRPVVDWGVRHGSLGVATFFVLSGFVICSALDRWRSPGAVGHRVGSIGGFLTRRLVRLTPPYYGAIALALIVAIGAAARTGGPYEPGLAPFSFGRLVAHLLYVQEVVGYDNFNDVFWTLAVELQFYVALVLLWSVKEPVEARWGAGGGSTIVVAAAVVGLAWPFAVVTVDGRSPWFMATWYSFAVGVMLSLTWQRRLARPVVWTYCLALLVAALLGGPNRGFVLATLATALVISAAIELRRLDRWLAARPFRALGRISYSLYLIHTPVLGAVFVVMAGIGPDETWWDLAAAMAGVAASLSAATIFHRLVEAPSIRLSRRVRPRRRSWPALRATASAG